MAKRTESAVKTDDPRLETAQINHVQSIHKLRYARGATARDVMTAEIHCCRDDDDLAKAVRHMEELKVRRLPVINKSKRMVGILSLGDVSHSAPVDVLLECVKRVSAHH